MSEWTLVRTYPVEGDSAVAELEHSSGLFVELWLEGMDLEALGVARIADAEVKLRVHDCRRFGRHTGDIDLGELTAHLDEARQWLLDNEQGRLP